MATVILVRHGRTTANATGVLAGRLAGVRLDERGAEQATATGLRLAPVRLAEVVSSPLERCKQTARAISKHQPHGPSIATDRGLSECDYGDWQGRALRDLAKEPLWKVVQSQPSAAVFPGGESMRTMQDRAVEAVRRHDRLVQQQHGGDAVWLAVSHGDVIKAILADALGTHLDLFQRIQVDPASVSIVRFTEARPYVLGVNTTGGDLSWLTPAPSARQRRRKVAQDAVVGGGAGPGAAGTPS
ncbi:MAG: Histidine phosphatase [Nocardioides sp.]|jgi:probable phosphomutase (TIGR03848 family)|uniref:histidine phosphatase family protein n=1 Tax=Nocardioides sp. TaxID=35761 RepID=UPI002617CBE6|nr:histidine phosphatase family protein [Nocardioides sp.]MCW2832595.1 Histidine phosphatase [Nocardioides sp.]